jgi:hypothetical protein
LALTQGFLVPSARAADGIEALVERLAKHSDFRVRVQAALALGASADARAVKPLCASLEDSSSTVRAAGAAALGRLRRGGQACLKARLDVETSDTVKKILARSLGLVGQSDEEPRLTEATRYYVAIGDITDSTGRKSTVDSLVRSAMAGAVVARQEFAVAPKGESPQQARKRLVKFRKTTGFFLSPTISAPRYSDGNLIVKVEIAIFTYPSKALKGMIPVKLTQPGVSSPDRVAEDTLIRAAAERAVQKFTENIDRIR